MSLASNLAKLPPRAYGVLNSNPRQVIGWKLGEPGYVPLRTKATPEEAQAFADHMNEADGVTKAQAAAMEAGSMFGFHVPGADVDLYDAEGNPIKEKLAAL